MAESDKPSSESARLYAEMKATRDEWMRASAELKEATALFRDLNLSQASPDGTLALKNARQRESEALRKYIAAVDRYGDAVLRGGQVVPPES